MKEVPWKWLLIFLSIGLLHRVRQGHFLNKRSFWTPQEMVLMIQFVVLYLPRQSLTLRAIKMGLWAVAFYVCLYSSLVRKPWEAGCPAFCSVSWPDTALANNFLPATTLPQLSIHILSEIFKAFEHVGLKPLGENYWDSLWVMPEARDTCGHSPSWFELVVQHCVLGGRMAIESPMSLVTWDICAT